MPIVQAAWSLFKLDDNYHYIFAEVFAIVLENCVGSIQNDDRAVTVRRFATLYVPDNLSESSWTVIRGGRRDLWNGNKIYMTRWIVRGAARIQIDVGCAASLVHLPEATFVSPCDRPRSLLISGNRNCHFIITV